MAAEDCISLCFSSAGLHRASYWLMDSPHVQGEIWPKSIWLQNCIFFPLTIAWGLVFCTTQSEYFYKSFIFFGQIFNRELNKTAMAETNGNGFGNEHCQELRWEALERRPRASGVLITDRMDVIRPCNKPATCRSGKRVPMQQSLQQWLLQGDLLKELMHQPRPVINAQNTIMFIPQFWYPNSLEVINWT